MPFLCFNWKNKLYPFVVWQLLRGWWVTTTDQSHPSVLYMYDRFFNWYPYVTPQMKKLIVTLLAGWLPPFFQVFYDRNCTFRLLLLSARDHWSPVPNCCCYSSLHCLIRSCCGLFFLKSKSWKLTLKYLKNAPVTLNSSDQALGIQFIHL